MELNRDQLVKLLEYCSKSKYCDGCVMRYHPRFLEARSFDPGLACGKVLLRWATECINELTKAHEMLSESYDHLEKTKDYFLAEKSRLTNDNASLHASCTEFERKCASLNDENERLRAEEKQSQILIETLHDKLDEGYAKFVDEERADTVQKMHAEIKERCIKGGIYPAFVASTIEQIAKEMIGDVK